MISATICAVALYGALLIGIGLLSYQQQQTSEDFLLGGRKLNYWVTAISAHASDMSSWLLMGFPGMVYASGLGEVWTACGLFCGMLLVWNLVAPRLRRATEQYNVLTLSSYLGQRYDDKTGLIRFTTATLCLFFFTFYIASGIRAMGIVAHTAFGIPYLIGITLSVLLVIVYTFLGGFTAVAWSDLFQGLFLLAMIILVPLMAIQKIGGWDMLYHGALNAGISLSIWPESGLLGGLITAASWGLGYFGQPHILNKFMGIKNPEELPKAQAVGLIWQALTLSAAVLVGIVGITYFNNGLVHQEEVFIMMVKSLFSPFFASFVLCSILAAALSTIDSQVLVFASVFAKDFYHCHFRPHADEQEIIWVSRTGVVLVCSLAYLLAVYEGRTIFAIVKYAWSGLGSSFGPVLLASLYVPQVPASGALAGIITGGVVSACWPHTNLPFCQDPMIPGFFLSLFAIILETYKTQLKSSA